MLTATRRISALDTTASEITPAAIEEPACGKAAGVGLRGVTLAPPAPQALLRFHCSLIYWMILLTHGECGKMHPRLWYGRRACSALVVRRSAHLWCEAGPSLPGREGGRMGKGYP